MQPVRMHARIHNTNETATRRSVPHTAGPATPVAHPLHPATAPKSRHITVCVRLIVSTHKAIEKETAGGVLWTWVGGEGEARRPTHQVRVSRYRD